MNRRNFLSLFSAGVAGIALEQAIPLGRVWSFPKKIVIPKWAVVPLELQSSFGAPTTQGSKLSPSDYQWLLIARGLQPLYKVDTSAGNYAETPPVAGVATSGQTGQCKEITYVKTPAGEFVWSAFTAAPSA